MLIITESSFLRLFAFSFVYWQLICSQNVRYNERGIEMYTSNQWYNIREKDFDYREGSVVCKELSDTSLLSYYETDSDIKASLVKLDCDPQDTALSQCPANVGSDKRDYINVTCMSSEGLSAGSIRQLSDGRIIYLYQPTGSSLLVWAHICYKENDNWDSDVADLFCRALGYENVKQGKDKIKFGEKVYSLGLNKINDCGGAASYTACAFSQKGGKGECKSDEVISIECENPITQATTQSTTQTTTTTTQSTTQPATTQSTTQPATTQSTTQTTTTTTIQSNSADTTHTTPLMTKQQQTVTKSNSNDPGSNSAATSLSTQNNTANRSDTYSGVGMPVIGAIVAFSLLILILAGGLITLIIVVLMVRRGRAKSKPIKYRHNLSVAKEYKGPAESYYLAPMEMLKLNDNAMNPNADPNESIYEGLITCYEHYVPPSEDRSYYSVTFEDVEPPSKHPFQRENNYHDVYGEAEYWEPGTTIEGIYSQMSHNHFREIIRSELEGDKVIGEGNFGKVVCGVWKSSLGAVQVAMKSIKSEADGTDLSFLQEAAILGQFNHPNVLKLLGMVTITKPLMMVTELMRTGLKEYLKNVKKSELKKFETFGRLFIRFTNDIANGMQHLSSKKFVHRDLSARNVLVSNSLTCKISDFGLARHAIEDDEYYTSSGGLIPLKWTAPEAVFYKKYSEKSDVWSYGITLYEIWAVGIPPWQGLKPEQVSQNSKTFINRFYI